MKTLSDFLGLGIFGLKCAQRAYNFWQGGNQWSAWTSFLTFFRYISKLEIDYSKFDNYEKLAVHSGPRVIHENFCMISDRPEVLLVDEQNRPHCETGPFCKWRDGSAIYAIHGVYVPVWLIETPKDQIDVDRVMKLPNVEQRMAAMKFLGPERLLNQLKAVSVNKRGSEYELFKVIIEGSEQKLLAMKNPSEPKTHYEFVPPDIETVTQALAWRFDMKLYKEPVAKT